MKKLLLFLSLSPMLLLAQQTKTTITNGDFYNPLTWDCFCVPASGDSLIINHTLGLNTDIYYTAGRITINPSGSLTQGGVDRDVWIDGAGSLVNHGLFSVDNLLQSQWCYIENTGDFVGLDSMLTQGIVNNSGTIEVYDFLIDQTGNFGNYGLLSITHNMNNQGFLENYADIDILNDFSNCNTQSMVAEITNYGIICISNDFLNCDSDLINGSGHIYIGNQGGNLGTLDGTLTFHTPSGVISNVGTIGSGVTVTTGACNLGVGENAEANIEVYPNPATESIRVSITDGNYSIIGVNGKILMQGALDGSLIDVSELADGIYYLHVNDMSTVKFIKH